MSTPPTVTEAPPLSPPHEEQKPYGTEPLPHEAGVRMPIDFKRRTGHDWRPVSSAAGQLLTAPTAKAWTHVPAACPRHSAERHSSCLASRHRHTGVGETPLTGETRPPGMSRGRVVNCHATPP